MSASWPIGTSRARQLVRQERDAANHRAEQVFLQLLDKFLDRGVNVSANPGPTYAPSRFADEKEARAAPLYPRRRSRPR